MDKPVRFCFRGAKVGEQEFRKTDDNIILLSSFSNKLNEKLKLSASGILELNYWKDVPSERIRPIQVKN